MIIEPQTKLRNSRSGYPDPSIATVNELIRADSLAKIEEFKDKWAPLFSLGYWQHLDSRVISDLQAYVEARWLLCLAAKLRELIQEKRCTIENLQSISINHHQIEEVESGEMCELYVMLQLSSEPFYQYLNYCQDSYSGLGIERFDLTGVHPDTAIMRLMDKGQQSEAERWFSVDVPYHVSFGLENACVAFLDALISIHLADFRIASANNTELKAAGSLLSALWLCFLDSYKTGRAGCCIVCQKPYIAIGERGKSRLYCSDSCSKMHQRYKVFEKLVFSGEDADTAAKNARIKLSTALSIKEHTS